MGILAAAGYLPPCDLQDFEFLGELGLSGKVRGVSGVLPSAIALGKGRRLIVPADNLEGASLADASRVHPIQRLMDVRAYLSGQVDFEAHTRNSQASKPEMHQIGAPNSRACSRQVERAGKLNRDLSTRELERDCALKSAERKYLTGAAETLKLSARGCHRTLKVARTIADLEDETRISRAHLSEALGYKSLEERTNWQ